MSFFIPTAATGNGLSLATIGRTGELMGFFYPNIDFAQNIREGMHAVRIGGQFRWCFEDCWRVAQSFERGSNVLVTRLAHRELELAIEISDVLPPGEGALLRRVVVTKSAAVPPVQFMQYLRMAVGDTLERNGVQCLADANAVVQHYRDIAIAVTADRPIVSGCSSAPPGVESATKVAMRSGTLGGIRQAIGQVDFAVALEPASGTRWQAAIVIAGGATPDLAVANARRLATLSFDSAVVAADARCAEYLQAAGPCTVPELGDAYERAVISLHDLYDETHGTFIAAPEFDPGFELSGGYGYCWPRDAAVCALAMQQIGFAAKAERFFAWAARTQLASGHWYQRYWTNGSPASAWCVRDGEIQLDQTCAMVHAAGTFARRLGPAGVTFARAYAPVIERATRAILGYVGPTGLHLPSSDLWENSVGSFTYTQAAIIAALREAEEIFGIDPALAGVSVRQGLFEQLIRTFWNTDRRRWLRRVTPDGQPDATLDSSAMGIIDPWFVLDLTSASDRTLAMETLDGISRDLRSAVKGGSAILRFQGESYMGGGPGCVNTLWLAVCRLRLAASAMMPAESRQQRALAMDELRIALANTSPTGQLPELIPKIRFDYWAAPHAWASSLLIEAVLALRAMDPPVSEFDAHRAFVRRKAPAAE